MAFLGFKIQPGSEPFADSSQGSTTAGSRIPRNAVQDALFNSNTPVAPVNYETNNLAADTDSTALLASLAGILRSQMTQFGLVDGRIHTPEPGAPLKYRLESSVDLQTWTPVRFGTNNSTTNAFLGRGQPWSFPLAMTNGKEFYRLNQIDDGNAAYPKWSGTNNRPDNPLHPPVP